VVEVVWICPLVVDADDVLIVVELKLPPQGHFGALAFKPDKPLKLLEALPMVTSYLVLENAPLNDAE
jgi:hypothetical protein